MPIARNRRPRPRAGKRLFAPAKGLPPAGGLPETGRVHVLDVPFLHRGVVGAAGARWDASAKAYVWRGDADLPRTLQPYAAPAYSWERLRQDEINGIEIAAPSIPLKTIVLRDHQRTATRIFASAVAAGRTTFLNADDVGLGKTFEALASIMESLRDAQTILIVCPLSAVAHWRRCIGWMGDGGKRWVVINYDRLKKLFDLDASAIMKARGRRKGRKVRTQKGVARYGDPYEFDVIVWDESHKLRNLETARSKFALKLNARADFLMWMSATAGQTPLELGYLAPLLSEATGARKSELADFEEWCADQGIGVSRGAFGKWKWRGNSDDPAEREAAEEDLDLIHRILFHGELPAGIRRSPSDIAGWPTVNRIMLPVALDAEDRASYALAWQEFRASLELERRRGKGDVNNPLLARLRFRQKASLLRTSATLDLAEDLIEQGKRVAISVFFKETLEILKEALEKSGYRTSRIDGGMTGGAKEKARLDFQYGRSEVCLYTVEESISLHEGEFLEKDSPRSNIVHDLRWSAIQMKQIEGRTFRDGRFSDTFWMLGEDTVEEDIAATVAARMQSMSRMHGDADTAADIEKLLAELVA